jgi:DNA-binding NarL/FixJ family response regulator
MQPVRGAPLRPVALLGGGGVKLGMTTLRVLLVDDHELYRSALRAHLGHTPGLEVVAEAVDGTAAVAMAARLHPDVVVMDLALPGDLDGLEATRLIRQEHPATAVVALSGYGDDELTRDQALRAGASELLDKTSALERLVPAIKAAVAGLDAPPSAT